MRKAVRNTLAAAVVAGTVGMYSIVDADENNDVDYVEKSSLVDYVTQTALPILVGSLTGALISGTPYVKRKFDEYVRIPAMNAALGRGSD